MDAKERYFWDLTGYLVIRNVLTPEELKTANEAINYYSAKVLNSPDDAGRLPGRPRIYNNVVVRTSNQHPYFLEMEQPYCEPFRNMLAHPQIVSRLNVMCGKGFRLDHGPELIGHIKGVPGGQLHGSGEPHKPYVAYHHQNGKSYVGGVTVSWQLADANEGDGGFSCVPGSHKSRYSMPSGVRTFEADMGVVAQPVVKSGDVIFFMDGAQTHGTLPWQAEHQRRSILFKYTSRTCVRQGPAQPLAHPKVYWDKEIIDGMTPEQLAVMYGPYSNYRDELPLLAVDADGTVRIDNEA